MTDIYKEILSSLDQEEKSYFKLHYKRYIEILKFSKIKKEDKILDIGLHPCHFEMMLSKIGFKNISGVDYEPKKIAKRCKEYNIRVKRANVEKDKLPFKDNEFDIIYFNEIIEHLSTNIYFTLNEIKRVLKPTGKLIVSTPNVFEISRRILFALGILNIYWDTDRYYSRNTFDRHNREYSMNELKDILKKVGFKIKKEKFMYCLEGERDIEKKNKLSKIVNLFQKLIPSFRSTLAVEVTK